MEPFPDALDGGHVLELVHLVDSIDVVDVLNAVNTGIQVQVARLAPGVGSAPLIDLIAGGPGFVVVVALVSGKVLWKLYTCDTEMCDSLV